ncbi:MAG TPA: FHA domain-containing protein, partial [Gemmataceae bacterium]|nr:FHA domain-containing protein [Gemmataceae bacterium]
RQDYRRAREALLEARGNQTIYAERESDDPDSAPSNTLIQKANQVKSGSMPCWLADDQYIYPLKVGLNTVGRSSDNDVVVSDCFISRRHCAILVHSQTGFELHDTASKNGVYLNGVRIAHPTSLKSGDAIRICERQFVFLSRDGRRREDNVTASF